jgi:LEA14-like dessication related protein
MIRREVLIGGMLLFLAACAGIGLGSRDLEPPEVTLADVQFRGAGLLEQQLGLVLRLRNPNDADLPLRGLKVRLNIDGEPFATGLSNENVTLPALGEKTVTVDAVSSTSELLNQLHSVTGLKDISYTIDGTAFLRGEADRKLPFEQKGVLRLSGLQ